MKDHTGAYRFKAVWMTALFLSLTGSVLGQNRVSERDNFHNTAYVKTDDEAVKSSLFKFGEALESENYPAAISFLLDVLKAKSDALVPLGGRTFLSVRETVLRRLARLPEDALAVYLERAGHEARVLLKSKRQASDRETLLKVVRLYPLTPGAFEAYDTLGRLAFETGDFLEAAHWFRRGLAEASRIPNSFLARDTVIEKEMTVLKREMTVSCYAALCLAGRHDEAEAFKPEGALTLGGRERSASDLESQLAALEPLESDAAPEWLSHGGFNHRGVVPDWHHTSLAPVWDRTLQQAIPDGGDGWPDPTTLRRRLARPLRSALFPIVHDGTLFLFDDQALYALDLETGADRYGPIAWDWSMVFGDRGVYLENVNYTGTAGNGQLYAVLNQRIEVFGEPARHQGVLLAVDLVREGYLRWVRGGRTDTDPQLEGVAFSGAPVVVAGKAFLLGTRYGQGGEVRAEAHLFGFDSETGALLFDRFLCSGAEVSRFEIRLGANNLNTRDRVELGAPIAEYGGILYGLTNLGVVAAVDAFTGELLWVFKYNRIFSQDPDRYYRDHYLDTGGWENSLPVVKAGRLLVAPEDSRFFYSLDTTPDPEGFIILDDPIEKSWYRTWLGAANDKFYFTARQGGRHFMAATGPNGEVIWETPHFEREDRITGRPLLTRQAILVPTERFLYRIDLRMKGLVSHAYPLPEAAVRRRGPDLQFGNIIAVGNYLVSLASEDVMVFKGTSKPE